MQPVFNLFIKHKYLTLSFLALVIILLLILILFPAPSVEPQPTTPTITATPTSIGFPSVTISPSITPAENSYEYNQALARLVQQYPWFNKLPLETSQYVVTYNWDKSSFRIRLKVTVTPTSQDKIVQEVLSKLKNLGVTFDPIPHYIIPVSP